MARVSAAIMAHPSRKEWVEPLMLKLGIDAGQHVDAVWDRVNDCWDTARRAWLAYDPGATHHLVIQDDAEPSRDLIRGVERALEFTPAESIMSLYVGTRRPMAHSVERVVRRATEAKPSFIAMNGLHWGVAVVIPVPEIRAMVDWCDIQTIRGDDNRIRRYFITQKKWPTWCPWPSLVDHRDIPSVLQHAKGRHAHRFIGAGASALDVDFSQGHITMDEVVQARTPIRRRREMSDATPAKKAVKKTAKKATAKKATTPKPETEDVKVEVNVTEQPKDEPTPPAPPAPEPQPQVVAKVERVPVVEVNIEEPRLKFPKDNQPVRRTDRRTTSKRFGRQ